MTETMPLDCPGADPEAAIRVSVMGRNRYSSGAERCLAGFLLTGEGKLFVDQKAATLLRVSIMNTFDRPLLSARLPGSGRSLSAQEILHWTCYAGRVGPVGAGLPR
jgi:hypothetical protein